MANDIRELFGHEASDTSDDADLLWRTKACPFVGTWCTKLNHDKSAVYGTCSVSSSHGNVVICPKRLYADDYLVLKRVGGDAFGSANFLTFPDYLRVARGGKAALSAPGGLVVALGQQSGKEVSIGNQMSMDWVLVHVVDGKISSYTGIEVQSIDTTNNYRDCWEYYREWRDSRSKPSRPKPRSEHGYNWANVHKRLIPQLIRKGLIFSRSEKVDYGLSFVLPEEVFLHFEDILGTDFTVPERMGADVLTVYTYQLGAQGAAGTIRPLVPKRKLHLMLTEFAERFVSGPNLPTGAALDGAVAGAMGLQFVAVPKRR
jgi:hypothetical protein